MHRSLVAALLFAVPVAAIAQTADRAPSRSGLDIGALNRSVDACTDFYEFACGTWVANNPVPADRRAWGTFGELQEKNFATLRRILETPGASGDRARASDYYAACMDEAGIERTGTRALEPELARIAALTQTSELPAFLAHFQDVATLFAAQGRPNMLALFNFGSVQDLRDATRVIAGAASSGAALPDRELYLKDDERSTTIRQQYVTHVQRMLEALGQPPEEAASGARAVLAIDTALAVGRLSAVARREPSNLYHIMPFAELQAMTPHFNWQSFLAASHAPALATLNVMEPAYFVALDAILAGTPTADLRQYFRWSLVHNTVVLLPQRFRRADFDFFSKTLRGQQAEPPRWRQCVTETDERLGEALGKAFVEETFGPQAKAETQAMVTAIERAMSRDIDEAAWMSEATKRAAHVKLDAVVDRIGYPDRWRDYGLVRVSRSDALGNFARAVTQERQRDLQSMGQPLNRGEWQTSPATVNAYYNRTQNTINFPAGILQPPFYGAGRDAAVNYGAAGSVIGHELSHGFDDQGRKFDGQGNLRDWWTPADGKAFDDRAQCLADEYSAFVVAGDTHVNGRQTLGENIGDNGGVRLALMAYLAGPGATPHPPIDGFTAEQRFFVGYAQLWCESTRPEAERLKAASAPHASNRYRVNGVLSNMPEFQQAFQCKADAPMVRQTQCRVW